MKRQNQNGRSMIEMIGVLAIIGIISVGGLNLIHNANTVRKETQLIADVAQLATITKKLSCQYEAGYGSYTNFLNQSEAIPGHMKYYSGDYIEVAQDAQVTITGGTVEEGTAYFVISVSDLDEGSCLRLATTDWGNMVSNSCFGVSVGSEDYSACMQSSDGCSGSAVNSSDTKNYPMKQEKAADLCTNDAVVKIWYRACR